MVIIFRIGGREEGRVGGRVSTSGFDEVGISLDQHVTVRVLLSPQRSSVT